MLKQVHLFFMAVFWLLLWGCSSHEATPEGSMKNLINASKYNTKLGVSYLQRGNLERSKQKILSALQQDPRSYEAHLAMAYYWEYTGDLAQAEQSYRRALRLARRKGEVHNNYGAFQCKQKNYREADRSFQRAMADNSYVKLAEVYENAGYCAQLAGWLDKAHRYFLRAVNIDERRAKGWLGLAEWALATKQPSKADLYLHRYEQNASITAGSTWLGYQISKQLGKRQSADKYQALLKKQFANSDEYQQFQRMRRT